MPSPLDLLMYPSHPGHVAALKRTTPASNTPWLTDIKSHLKIETTAEDTLLQLYINAAVDYVENVGRRSLLAQKWTLTLDSFPSTAVIQLYNGPVTAVDTFTTYALDNVPDTTFTDYVVDTAGDRILLTNGYTWPVNLRPHAAVAIEYSTGYGAAVANVPPLLAQAVRMLVGKWHINRDEACQVTAEMAMGVSDLISVYRPRRL